MSLSKNPYAILGIQRNASKDAIKRAYFDIAKRYHPDINKTTDAAKKFMEASKAYQVLSDDVKRDLFDKMGFSALGQDNAMGIVEEAAVDDDEDQQLGMFESTIEGQFADMSGGDVFGGIGNGDRIRGIGGASSLLFNMEPLFAVSAVDPTVPGKDVAATLTLTAKEASSGVRKVVHTNTVGICRFSFFFFSFFFLSFFFFFSFFLLFFF